MSKKNTHTLKYTKEEIDAILEKAERKPFLRWHDEAAGVYRFFPDEERMRIWVEAYLNNEMTAEIAEYEFTEPITAPAPYTINITVIDDNRYILQGTEGVTLDFTFETRDGHQGIVQESVDVYYTFRSPSGTKTAASVYNPGSQVSMNIDEYLSLGTNSIAIMVRGRATGASKTIIATYNVVKLELSSNFRIARSVEPNKPFDVSYTVEGAADKSVEFYIDGVIASNAYISSLEPIVTKVQRFQGLPAGKHTLQILAKMQVGTHLFRSKLLYFEFIVQGAEMTTTVIAESFPPSQEIFQGSTPGLNGEQYVIKEIEWAYFSSVYSMRNATIQWRLYTEEGDETPIATRNADVVVAETDVPPEPLRFMPTESGSYHLHALVNGVIIGDYTISVIPNTAGIIETTDGLTMKLSGLGRDNAEPVETKTSWSDRGFSTEFFNMPWNGNAGWDNNALVLNNGSTARINNKPYASEVNPQTRNGCVFEIDFETFNVNEDDAELLRIGGVTGPSLVITASKAVLKSGFGRTIESRFKSDERIKVAFVVYPNSGTDYARKVFVYNNGVMSGVVNYELADTFNIGSLEDSESTVGMINLGNAANKAGIKIYYIRTYSNFINMYEELNNYFIDSGQNLQHLVTDNDIYTPGTKFIDIDKLESTITTVKMTGPIDELINRSSGKGSVTSKLEVVSPVDSNINLRCELAQVTNAGQSTLDKPVPSFHVKLDKNGNICYDRDGKAYPKNRYAFRSGNVPEKKFRLQANYMDSSGCHNGAFFRMFNEVAPKVRINGKSVLRIPAEVYASDNYPAAMQAQYGTDPSGAGWKFPYNIHMTPDSIPCVVVWRPDENSDYRFLGQYVIMEEKKANYANGMHSIYSGLDYEGNSDPFGFNSSKTGTKLWDNSGCHQVEILRSTEDLTLFLADDNYNEGRDEAFELIYPDEDDLTPSEVEAEWQKFYDDVVHPVVSSVNDQSAFEELLYGDNPKLDRWHFAAYYCLAMRNACTDSMVRNMEFVTYDGHKWLPKWWDVDMQCGLQQTGECNIVPTSDRTTLAPGSTTAFAFSGRMYVGGQLKSSWLWDALEASHRFMQDVRAMDAALYAAGWTYSAMTKIQDEEYIDAWSNALFNESSVAKYLLYNDLLSLQGDRTPHRHWFLRTSYDFFDAKNVCGEYTSKLISIRTQSIAPDKHINFKASATSYFVWGYTTNIIQSGILVEKGETGQLTIDRTLALNDPLHIFAANKISEIDLSEIAENIAGADIDFSGSYDEILGSQMKKLVIGVTKERMNTGVFNLSTSATEIQGAETLNRLEHLNIQGFQHFVGMNLSAMNMLTHYYAAGSRLDSFNPANGSNFTVVELPTSVTSMQMDGCNLTDGNGHCVIKWFKTNYENGVPVSIEEVTIPSTLRVLLFSGMGTDHGTQELVLSWINSVYNDFGDAGLANLQITCRNVNWEGVSVSDLLKLSKIPSETRIITGRIKCSGELSSTDIINIQNAFGQYVFTNNPGVPLRIDADAGFILGAPAEILAGKSAQVTGVSFPIEGSSSPVKYRLGVYNEQGEFVSQARQYDSDFNRYYYQYKYVTLDENTGEITTQERDEQDYDVVVEGANLTTADYATITIKRRTYPSAVDYSVEYTEGKDVLYDEGNDAYYILSDDVRIILTGFTIPENVTGTVVFETWSISQSIRSLCHVERESDNILELYVEHAGAEMTIGTITYKRIYIGPGGQRERTFIFKSPVVALTTRHNAPLQAAVYNAGYANDETFAYDVELWFITDLSFALGVGSQLLHLAEINKMMNLAMTTLDLSNCTNLGNNPDLVDLEDGTQDYINILPRRSQTLAFDFEEVDMRGTHLAGANLKEGNVLETVSYSDYAEEVVLVNQSALTEVNIPEVAADTLEKLIIENCNNLEEITWN